jgi:hypothetical protein
MRVTNIDTLSAFLDRLITENIKLFFFKKDKMDDKVEHQQKIILEIKQKIDELLLEASEHGYKYMSEKRTFVDSILENVEDLVTNDINIGESDRKRLEICMMEEKRLRKSNEGRSKNKNNIDENFKKLMEK